MKRILALFHNLPKASRITFIDLTLPTEQEIYDCNVGLSP